MANTYQVNATQLTPGATVVVRGKTTFSRLSRLVEGEELMKANASRVQKGMSAINRPYTTISLAHASVQPADPANPTLEELFVAERHYLSKVNPEQGNSYGIDNKSNTLPIVGVRNAQGQVEQVVLERDLAADLDVSIVLRVYKPKEHPNCGLSLEYVIVEEPIRYYNSGIDQNALAARGIIFAAPPVTPSGATAAPAAGADAYTNGLPPGTDVNTGLPAPASAMQTVAATPPVMQQTPAPAPMAQAQQVAMAQPVAQAAPGLTAEQELAMLRAQIAAGNASGGASAFVGAPAATEAPAGNPWNTSTPGAVPQGQGISFSG